MGIDVATRGFRVRGLGEVAIRCTDLERMATFYQDVIGLERLKGAYRDGIVFFRIADGVAGHTAVLALFGDAAARPGPHSTLHHLALSLPIEEQDAVIAWYERLGLVYRIETFPWIGWRGVFTTDPEGNTVEIVAHDPATSQRG